MVRAWIFTAVLAIGSVALMSSKTPDRIGETHQSPIVERKVKPRLIDINRYRRPDRFYNKKYIT